MWDEGLDDVACCVSDFLRWKDDVQLVSRASLGLEAVLSAWSARHGKLRVALSPIVCQDVVSAILEAGCTPHFVDVDPRSGAVSQLSWMQARAEGCRVAIVVHLFGHAADVAAVRAVFDADDCLVVDDAAQAFGTMIGEHLAGTHGDVGLLSFGPTKQISTGGAAVLVRSPSLLSEVRDYLGNVTYAAPSVTESVIAIFRRDFDRARDALAVDGHPGNHFRGLLEGYGAAIRVAVDPSVMLALPTQLENFREVADARLAKAQLWRQGLFRSRFVPISVSPSEVPWRYACRLPGSSWAEQRDLASAIRASGVSASNWYIPAHWYQQPPQAPLPKAERFACEVFQFWIDSSMDAADIEAAARRVCSLVGT